MLALVSPGPRTPAMRLPLPAALAAQAPPSCARGALRPNSADTERALGCSPSQPSAGASVLKQQSPGGRLGGKWPLAHPGSRGRAPREKRGSSGQRTHGLMQRGDEEPTAPNCFETQLPHPWGRPAGLGVPKASGAPLLFLNPMRTVSRAPRQDPNTTCACVSALRESLPPSQHCPRHLQAHGTPRGSWRPSQASRPGRRTWAGHAAPSARRWRPGISSGPAKGKQERPSRRAAGGWVVQTLSLARSAAWQAATSARCWAGARRGEAGQLCQALCCQSGACSGTLRPPQHPGRSWGP